ncbi:5-enol-pyruvylshikimate-phosphate synthase [Tanacetum coccineum]
MATLHINNTIKPKFTSTIKNAHNPSSKSNPSSFLSFGSKFNTNPFMHSSVSSSNNTFKRNVSASVATTEKVSKAPDEIVLKPIKDISGTVNLPGSKSLSNRILLLAALAEGYTCDRLRPFSRSTLDLLRGHKVPSEVSGRVGKDA